MACANKSKRTRLALHHFHDQHARGFLRVSERPPPRPDQRTSPTHGGGRSSCHSLTRRPSTSDPWGGRRHRLEPAGRLHPVEDVQFFGGGRIVFSHSGPRGRARAETYAPILYVIRFWWMELHRCPRGLSGRPATKTTCPPERRLPTARHTPWLAEDAGRPRQVGCRRSGGER